MKKLFIALILLLSISAPVFADDAPLMPVYRSYNPVSGEHFYTASALEDFILTYSRGWVFTGPSWYFYLYQGTPVYRLHSQTAGNHLYTTDKNEVDTLAANWGWSVDYDGNACFRSAGPIPIYRLYLPNRGLHLWTPDLNEYTTLQNYGWIGEGIAFYGYGPEG